MISLCFEWALPVARHMPKSSAEIDLEVVQ
jgi:hypothetical protein